MNFGNITFPENDTFPLSPSDGDIKAARDYCFNLGHTQEIADIEWEDDTQTNWKLKNIRVEPLPQIFKAYLAGIENSKSKKLSFNLGVLNYE